ncbi:MAG: hypothetical protein PHN32_06110 [Actinomycetota bacterium]|jgi:hypothetical protein|nr:hypothetical protein [Actinomycetota bacterium]
MNQKVDQEKEQKSNSPNNGKHPLNRSQGYTFRLHWVLVLAAVLLVGIISYSNQVSIYESMRRSFYAGAVFWVIAEIIDYLIRKKD